MVNRTRPEHKKTIGQWTWNSRLLNEKVIKKDSNECWPSTNFSQTKHGPLFGAVKNGQRQMTQLCRILYRDWFNIDCEENEITHKCGDKTCLNPNHWEITSNKKHGARPKSKWFDEQ
jgi:hypothetical protein